MPLQSIVVAVASQLQDLGGILQSGWQGARSVLAGLRALRRFLLEFGEAAKGFPALRSSASELPLAPTAPALRRWQSTLILAPSVT